LHGKAIASIARTGRLLVGIACHLTCFAGACGGLLP
jgi:hypothetical protein